MTDRSFDTNILAQELYRASRQSVPPIDLISVRFPSMSIDDAYAVSQGVSHLRIADGERLTGKKIGLTSTAVQQLLGVEEPDFGFLTDRMEIADGTTVDMESRLNTPMIETEIAFILKSDLPPIGVTPEQILDATDYICACFEIVDTRFHATQIKIVDTIADNASSALYVLGQKKIDPRAIDLSAVECVLTCNGAEILKGNSSAVMGNPLNSIMWLANQISAYGATLNAGDIILSGSMTPFAPVKAGDTFQADMGSLGSVAVAFF